MAFLLVLLPVRHLLPSLVSFPCSEHIFLSDVFQVVFLPLVLAGWLTKHHSVAANMLPVHGICGICWIDAFVIFMAENFQPLFLQILFLPSSLLGTNFLYILGLLKLHYSSLILSNFFLFFISFLESSKCYIVKFTTFFCCNI